MPCEVVEHSAARATEPPGQQISHHNGTEGIRATAHEPEPTRNVVVPCNRHTLANVTNEDDATDGMGAVVNRGGPA